jgi:adenosylcobinamide-phosphate synthase
VDRFWLLALALILDATVGDPHRIWQAVPHPVVLAGRLIETLDRKLNRSDRSTSNRRIMGVLAILIVVFVAVALGWMLEQFFASFIYGWIGTVIVAAVMLAGRSLYDHVEAVKTALEHAGIDAARSEIAKIVGRDPGSLDESAISRAAIESAAENFSDGLVAPAFWFAILGLPGLLAYKAINTADSMIGHRTENYRDFGWAAARLDDLVNWPAARLAGTLIALAAPVVGGSTANAFRAMFADAGKHRSPNAGWPEAAMAGGLGIALAGPRSYRGIVVDDPFMHAKGRQYLAPSDIRNCLRIYVGAWCVLLAFVLAIATSILLRG